MATRIIEYGGTGILGRAFPVIPAAQFVTKQSAMTATGSSAQSAAFNAATVLVHVISNEAISLEMGTNPTATDDSEKLIATGDQFFSVPQGLSWKVAIKTTAT